MDGESDLDDAIVQGIYHAAAGLIPWTVPLEGLFKAFRGRSMQLLFVDHVKGRLLDSEQPSALFDAEAVQGVFEYIREWAQHDPHIVAVAQLPVGEVYDSEGSGARSTYADHSFYRDYWSAYGNRGLIAAKVANLEDRAAMFGIVRSDFHPQFSKAECELFSRYVTHMVSAMELGKYVQGLRVSAIAGKSLMDASHNAMLLLDRRRVILVDNARGVSLLEDGQVFRMVHGTVECTASAHQAVLETALADIDPASGGKKIRTAFVLHDTHGARTLCTLWCMRPDVSMGAFGSKPSYLLTVISPRQGAADHAFLASLYDLTPVEAQVAAALASGTTLPPSQ